jgi:hypothetical protein
MKAFYVNGKYIPASAIMSFKPPGSNKFDNSWIITLVSNEILTVNIKDAFNAETNLKSIEEIGTYFGVFEDGKKWKK